jgi:hypothetical protein
VAIAVCRADGPYHFIKEIPVSGEGAWDYCSVDSAGQRLYLGFPIWFLAHDRRGLFFCNFAHFRFAS